MKPLFGTPELRSVSKDKAIINKTKRKSPATKRGGGIATQIAQIEAHVNSYLGKFKYVYFCVKLENESLLEEEITRAIEKDIIAIDTETTGLDPIEDKCVGFSIYTADGKALYVPLNHVSYVTGMKAKNQISKDFAVQQLQRLADAGTKIVMFNAVFDIRVIRNQLGVDLDCYWDVSLASRLMNENEGYKNNGLKKLYQKYILKNKEDVFKFDELFNKIGFDKIPIKTGYLYAAHDAKITFDLYEYQKRFIFYDEDKPKSDRNGMNGVSWVFFNIEMPCVKAVANLEDTGVSFDLEYAQELHDKYQKIYDDRKKEAEDIISMYADEIEKYSGNVRLDNPINLDSPSQLSVLLYDIIGEKPVDKKKPRGTGEDILNKIGSPLCKAILDYRAVGKLMSTYIDKLPKCVHKDGRIHCKFNQYGADTGRFSSSDPNLQNIPSHNKDIRKMFKATDGYVMMSADYGQQEPKVMTMMCKDPKMIKAYQEGKDLYAEIAALSFNTTYEDCLEFRPDGTTNPDGKSRRSQAKSILLGVLYGRGVPSIAEQLGTTTKKAQQIKDSVMKGFPAIENFEQDSLEMAEDLGYVTTLWGRKRRLPILMLDDYEFEWKEGVGLSDDPLDFDTEEEVDDYVPDDIVRSWTRKLSNTWKMDERQYLIKQAADEGIIITDNSKKKEDAVRQVVNSRIQGSAADMTKLAMIMLENDKRLKELGFRMLIPVHDEIIAECPKENAKECVERFSKIMSEAPGEAFTIPISCDVSVTYRWYGDELKL